LSVGVSRLYGFVPPKAFFFSFLFCTSFRRMIVACSRSVPCFKQGTLPTCRLAHWNALSCPPFGCYQFFDRHMLSVLSSFPFIAAYVHSFFSVPYFPWCFWSSLFTPITASIFALNVPILDPSDSSSSFSLSLSVKRRGSSLLYCSSLF